MIEDNQLIAMICRRHKKKRISIRKAHKNIMRFEVNHIIQIMYVLSFSIILYFMINILQLNIIYCNSIQIDKIKIKKFNLHLHYSL